MDFHWSMYSLAFWIFPEISKKIVEEAEQLLEEVEASWASSTSSLFSASCILGAIWRLHYLVKHGLLAGKSSSRISFAALTLSSWLTSCERMDDHFLEDLWGFVRLTPSMVRYTIWLSRPMEAWPTSVREGSFIDVGAGSGVDSMFYRFYAMSGGSQQIIAIDSDYLNAQRLRRQPELFDGVNVSILYRLLVQDADTGGRQRTRQQGRTRYVQRTTCRDVLLAAPQPVRYVKIDIEEFAWACLETICRNPGDWLPRHMSVEDPGKFFQNVDVVRLLSDCGYNRFKLVRQEPYTHVSPHGERWCTQNPGFCSVVNGTWSKHLTGSGPFGDDATDWRTGLKWRDADSVRSDLKLIHTSSTRLANLFNIEGDTFDIHAELGVHVA